MQRDAWTWACLRVRWATLHAVVLALEAWMVALHLLDGATC